MHLAPVLKLVVSAYDEDIDETFEMLSHPLFSGGGLFNEVDIPFSEVLPLVSPVEVLAISVELVVYNLQCYNYSTS